MTEILFYLLAIPALFLGLALIGDTAVSLLAYATGFDSYWRNFYYERWPIYLRLILGGIMLNIAIILVGWVI